MALRLDGVTAGHHRGGRRVEVLRGLDLEVAVGEVVAVVGRSGSGKSTLLHVAAGLTTPTAGRVVVGSVDTATLGSAGWAALRQTQVGMVFQAFHLLGALTLAENVALPLLVAGSRPAAARARATERLTAVGLADRAADRPAGLSGGEQQRAAIARALVGEPAVVLADEPTGALDADSATGIVELLVNAARDAGAGVVLVTHDRCVAGEADRVLTLDDGVLR